MAHIDLSNEFHPVPKVFKAKKEPKPLKKIGKKGIESLDEVKQSKKDFEAVGIITCEIKFEKICWNNNALSFAHLKKRRHLDAETRKKKVLACVPCHQVVEAWHEAKMEAFLQGIIDRRIRQP